ncbi:MAG: SCO family protein [Magnetococcales bacterium]|nr:SCO family protein [Magnetococcales bacterium]
MSGHPTPPKKIVILVLAMAITLITILIVVFRPFGGMRERGMQVPGDLMGALLPFQKPLTDFQLTDHQGKAFTLARLQNQWTLLFFGYTHCPDVCPMALGFLGEVFTHLGKDPFGKTKLQGVFVSVDPKRDSLELLKDYVAFFNPEFLGATGPEPMLKDLAQQVGAYYAINPGGTDDAYEVSHSSAFFMISPQGNLVGVVSPNNNTPDQVAEKIKRIVQYLGHGEKP